MDNVNVRLEYDKIPIRHLAIQCPECKSWLNQDDIVINGSVLYTYELAFTECYCPICQTMFNIGDNPNIEECEDHKQVYKDCKQKKVE